MLANTLNIMLCLPLVVRVMSKVLNYSVNIYSDTFSLIPERYRDKNVNYKIYIYLYIIKYNSNALYSITCDIKKLGQAKLFYLKLYLTV